MAPDELPSDAAAALAARRLAILREAAPKAGGAAKPTMRQQTATAGQNQLHARVEQEGRVCAGLH